MCSQGFLRSKRVLHNCVLSIYISVGEMLTAQLHSAEYQQHRALPWSVFPALLNPSHICPVTFRHKIRSFIAA